MDVQIQEQTLLPGASQNILMNALKNTRVSFVLLLIIIIGIYIGIFFLVGNNNNITSNGLTTNDSSTNMIIIVIEVILWAMLIALVYVNMMHYSDENVSFRTKMENLFNTKLAELEVHADKEKEKEETKEEAKEETKEETKCVNNGGSTNDGNKEVFHFPDNVHTYSEAQKLCEKHGARLASYDEIERAYNNGANWCSYGWSQEQMALFPTQKAIYNELKKIPGHEYDCGRPGINGGFFNEPKIKFGVNCYGVKPKANKRDENYMHALNHSPAIRDNVVTGGTSSLKQQEPRKIIAPFNRDKWTAY